MPCTVLRMENTIEAGQLERQTLTKAVAQGVAGFVQAAKAHHNQCPFRECADCKKIHCRRGSCSQLSLA
jgi:hypothetical protein